MKIARLKVAPQLLAALTLSCASRGDNASANGDDEKRRGGFSGSAFTTHEALESKILLGPGIVPAAGTVNGTGIDREDAKSALVFCALTDIVGGTSVVVDVEESDVVGSGYTDVTGATFTAFTPTRDNGVYYGNLDLRGRKQFLRVTEVTTGTFSSGSRYCGIVLAGQVNLPVTWAQATADFNVR